jgi:hypothetical protein
MYLACAQLRDRGEEKSVEKKGVGEKGRSTASQRCRSGIEAVPP